MGREKQRMEEGYCSKGDLSVCASCIEDEAIKLLIEYLGVSAECSYCGSTDVKVCSLDHIVSHIVESIKYEWDDPANAGVGWESREGGWLGASVYSTYELLTGELELGIENDDLLNDINSSILNSEWCKKSPYSLSEDQRLFYGWESFSDYVKYNSRYVLFKIDVESMHKYKSDEVQPEELLEQIGSFINQHNLTKTLGVSIDIYRVRIVSPNTTFNTANELGSPPKENCTLANRMSPAGIPMFYGAFDMDTAINETYEKKDGVDKKAICGVFNPIRPLAVIDLSSIPPVPSLFDEENRYFRDSLGFLKDFVVDFCKPIERTDRAHIDYVPTQIVTEYFRHVLLLDAKQKIDGVIYPSSKDEEKQCVVIFADSYQCGGSNEFSEDEQILVLNKTKEKQLTAMPDF